MFKNLSCDMNLSINASTFASITTMNYSEGASGFSRGKFIRIPFRGKTSRRWSSGKDGGSLAAFNLFSKNSHKLLTGRKGWSRWGGWRRVEAADTQPTISIT